VGGFYSFNDHIVLRADAVVVDERSRAGTRDSYPVMLLEIGVEL
jgi:hypothetical protein